MVDGGDVVVVVVVLVLELGQVPVRVAAELLVWLPAAGVGWSDR